MKMEFLASIYEKTNNGAFFRGNRVVEAENMEEAIKKAELPADLRKVAMVEISPLCRDIDKCN